MREDRYGNRPTPRQDSPNRAAHVAPTHLDRQPRTRQLDDEAAERARARAERRAARAAESERGSRTRRDDNVYADERPDYGGIRIEPRIIALAVVAVLALGALVLLGSCVAGCVGGAGSQDSGETQEVATHSGKRSVTDSYVLLDQGRTTASGDGRVTFCAVGDNLMNQNLLDLVYSWNDDGTYDFSPLYREIEDDVAGYDVAFINQETTLGGTDQFDYSGYPSYNTPDSMADAVEDAGFRVVTANTNHTYDTWVASIEHALGVWAEHDNVLLIGSYASAEDAAKVQMVECNGLRIAFLSYSYGQNGYELSDLPNDYYAVPIPSSQEELAADVAAAREVADVVVVYLHDGVEYTHEPSEEQRSFAQWCADEGVDLMIGSHCHWIQSMEWITRGEDAEGVDNNPDDSGNQMLAVYGLGDFLSGYHNNPECVLSGMFSCTFVRKGDTVHVEDVVWTPLIEHWEGTEDYVIPVRDYTEEMAENNELLTDLDDPYAWLRETSQSVIGDGFTIDM